MSESHRCPQCQAEIPAGAPEGLCPQCLLKAGLESKTGDPSAQTAAYTPTGTGFVPPAPEALQPAFPQLEILELLGKGGMGAVYKAKQRGLDRLVAVKILPPEYSRDPSFTERFMREAKALAQLSHPNIVGVHDVGQAGGYCFFIMEFVDGVNLRQAMKAGNLKPAEALRIVPQICDALQFAHDEGIVHRDIKPENILLDKKGRVKIADFGLAKLLGKTTDVSLTGTQQVMGTLHYMAPEQFLGARDVDHRADIYSLGVTFYEMLTGELPIGRFAVPSKKVQIDVRLDDVVLRSLEKEPEQRYQHASEIKTEVEAINLTPASNREAPPQAKFPNTTGLNPVCLLEATSGWKRWLALVFLAAGVLGAFVVMALGLRDGNACAGLSLFIGLMLLSIIPSLLLRLRWTVEYRGHQIAVEFKHASASRRLTIDGLTVATATGMAPASGGKGWDYELRATIPHGQGVGDELVCTVESGINIRCRIIAFPRTPIAPALEAKEPELRYQQASEIKTEMESVARGSASETSRPVARPMAPFWYRFAGIAGLVGLALFLVEGLAILLYGDELSKELRGPAWAVFIPCAGVCLPSVSVVCLFVWIMGRRAAAPRSAAGKVSSQQNVPAPQPGFLPRAIRGLSSFIRAHVSRKSLAVAWTLLCVLLFVLLWTPYEGYRASWSGYLDGEIWPYREFNDCAISLEPKVPTCKRIVIREKTELALSGNPSAHKNFRLPDVHRTSRLTYDIEVQPLQGQARLMVVDALNGMSLTADQRSGSILDALSLAEWLREDGVSDKDVKDFQPGNKLTVAGVTSQQARDVVQVIQLASREQYVFYYELSREFGKRTSRLQLAADRWFHPVPLSNVFVSVPGWNAAESVKVEPVVPILYIGVPLMLAIWGIGLGLLMRRRPAAA